MNDNGMTEVQPPLGDEPAIRSRRRFSAGTVALLVISAALVSAVVTYAVLINVFGMSDSPVISKISRKLTALHRVIEKDYVGEIDEAALEDSVLKGYMRGLGDNYADYYNSEEYQKIMSGLAGETHGIGINVVYNADFNAPEIVSVCPGSPADKAGVLTGDIIAYIGIGENAQSVAGLEYSDTIDALAGDETSSIEFTVLRGEGYTEKAEFSVTRGDFEQLTVYSRLYEPDNSVGVVRITGFDKNTPKQFIGAVNALKEQGAEAFILDVRNNPGGELVSVCSTLDFLLPEGPVIRTVDKSGNEQVVYTSDANELGLPLAVLINGNTASAGELFAAALSDYNRATLVGTTTFGKGSMQTTAAFRDNTAFKYTYRYYCPPFSPNYDGVGISPDITVEPNEELLNKNIFKITDSEDNQLEAAYKALFRLPQD